MANYKAKNELLCQLSLEDRTALLSIYQHRCLDAPLLDSYVYRDVDVASQQGSVRVNKLRELGLIESVEYGQKNSALFLTTLGVEAVKTTSGKTLRELYQFDGGKQTLPLAHDLKMNPKIINHQMHLNSFAMELASYASGQGYFRYFDEKMMPPASNFMMPDAMAELDNCYLFLEMDMGTEAKGRLAQKWNSYRTFLNDPAGFYREKRVVMLFIIDGVKNVELRKRNVTAGLMTHIADRVNGRFEAYIDGVEALHKIVKTRILPPAKDIEVPELDICRTINLRHGFSVSRPAFFQELDVRYTYYIRSLDENRRVLVSNGRAQEFILDVWMDGRLSILRNVLFYQRSLGQICKKAGRDIAYVIVVPSEKAACVLLKELNSPQPEGIYFTTPDRLTQKAWPQALFSIDLLWNLNHFTDESLKETVHEKRLFRF